MNALLTAALRLVDPLTPPRCSRCAPAATPPCSAWDAWTRRTRSTATSRSEPDRVGEGGRDGGAGALPQPPDPFCRGDRARPGIAARVGIAVPPRAGSRTGSTTSSPASIAGWTARSGRGSPSPELCDPALLAASRLIDAVLPLAYYVADPPMIAWLAMEAVRIWIEHGPGRLLVGSAAHAAYQAGPQRDDYPAAYLALRRIVALGEAHGYEPGTSQARYMAATMAGWFEPLETGVRAVHRARDGLIAGGELTYGGYSYQLSVPYSMDCAPSLASLVTEIDDGFAFLRRTGNEQTGRWLDSYAWLARVLRSEGATEAREAVPLERYADDPTALIYAHLCRAIAAAVFGIRPGSPSTAPRRWNCSRPSTASTPSPRSACCAAWRLPRRPVDGR